MRQRETEQFEDTLYLTCRAAPKHGAGEHLARCTGIDGVRLTGVRHGSQSIHHYPENSLMKNAASVLLPFPLLLVCLACLTSGSVFAHHRKGVTYKVFQFPPDMLPKIDGDSSDWQVVPESYTIDSSHLMDTVMGKGKNMDPKDLAVEVKVAWSPETNRLYFLYKMYDDMHNFNLARGDIFEVVIDADHSGGRYHSFDDVDEKTESRLKSTTAQNYHIFTPPAKGKAWAWVWGEQQWLIDKPWAEHAFKYDFAFKEAGVLYLEFSITPFNYASFRGPEYSALHKMEEGEILGLSWSVLDYDEDDKRYEGFWNLSHHTRMDYTASLLVNFRLMALEKPKKRR